MGFNRTVWTEMAITRYNPVRTVAITRIRRKPHFQTLFVEYFNVVSHEKNK